MVNWPEESRSNLAAVVAAAAADVARAEAEDLQEWIPGMSDQIRRCFLLFSDSVISPLASTLRAGC